MADDRSIWVSVDRRAGLALTVATAGAIVVWLAVTAWKYDHLLYDALDLAIYAQVFWNTSYGRWFEMSLHPQSYLGDHFEPLIVPLALLYRLWRNPLMLLTLQTLAVHLAVVPLYLFARNVFRRTASVRAPQALALVVAFTYLFNPFLHNALVFEFHLLPFFLLYWADQGRLYLTLGSLLLALAAREDVALAVAPFGAAAYLLGRIRRPRDWLNWGLLPLVMSGAWFGLSLALVSRFSPTGQNKFALYYGVLDDSVWRTLAGIISRPGRLLANFLNQNTLLTAAGLLLPFAFLPLAAPGALGLSLLSFLEFTTFTADSREVLIVHYGVLFLPALFLATTLAIAKAASWRPQLTLLRRLGWPNRWPLHLGVAALLAGTMYTTIPWGTLKGPALPSALGFADHPGRLIALRRAAMTIQSGERVVAPKRLLPSLAQRSRLYSLHYILQGSQQLSTLPYVIAEPVDALIIDQGDFLSYATTIRRGRVERQPDSERAERLRRFIEERGLGVAWAADGVAVLRPNRHGGLSALVDTTAPLTQGQVGTPLARHLRAAAAVTRVGTATVQLTMRWLPEEDVSENYVAILEQRDERGYSFAVSYFDPGWGVQPTDTWRVGTLITTRYPLHWTASGGQLTLSLFPKRNLLVTYGALRSAVIIRRGDPVARQLTVEVPAATDQKTSPQELP
jgi:uncharacterized membrane protein